MHPAAAAYSVQLNGIVGLFTPKMAMFVLGRGENYQPTSFMLSEGESQFGIKLLAVDVAGQRVLIERYNKKSYLNLRGTPNLTAAAPAPPVVATTNPPAPGELSVDKYLGSEAVQRIKAGNPVWSAAPPASRQNTGAPGDNAGAADSENNAGNSSTATAAPADFTKELWYQDSLTIEQERAATVAEVLSGQKTPWPRTPLTPPGTPAQLVDRETLYGSYIPGLRPYGFVD